MIGAAAPGQTGAHHSPGARPRLRARPARAAAGLALLWICLLGCATALKEPRPLGDLAASPSGE